MSTPNYPLYTVSRCRKRADILFGVVHGSMDAHKTICGIEINGDGGWWIMTNDRTGEMTCRACLLNNQIQFP